MADMLSLDLVDKGVVTNQIVLTVGYDKESLADGHYTGEVVCDHYGRKIPKHAHGTQNLGRHTSSTRKMLLIKHKYGKNAILKGTNYTEGATARERNRSIGGHKA